MTYLRGETVRVWIPGHGYCAGAAEIVFHDLRANLYRVRFSDGTTAWSAEHNLTPQSVRNVAFYKPDDGEDCR